MSPLDLLRMRRALFPQQAPDKGPKRFAPYQVWSAVRLATLGGLACYVLAVLLLLLTGSPFALLLFVPAIVLAPPIPDYLDRGLSASCDLLGNLLASRYCPRCGQSIFDNSPASGYFPDHARERWWPSRLCANCGHDLKHRTAP